jgi:zinc transport system substrate-binding protein
MRYIISSALTSLALAAPAMAEVPRVITDIPPVHSLVAQVMGDLGSPELLLERGASEHEFQLRPSQAAALAEAGLVVWVGPELTPWLTRALDGLGDGAEGQVRLGLLAADGTFVQDYAEAGAHGGHEGHDHGHDDHGHDDHGHDGHGHEEAKAAGDGHDHAGEEGHAHTGTDPHAWLDPANAKHWLGLVAEELAKLDPANAATYRANAAAAQAAVDALDAEVAATLAPVKDRPAIVFHDAYGYLAGHYGLTITGSIALGDATAPGAARMAGLRDEAEGGAVACVFPEAQHDAGLAEQLAEGTGARLGGALDPVGSTLEPGPALYGALMRGMAQTLAGCLAG